MGLTELKAEVSSIAESIKRDCEQDGVETTWRACVAMAVREVRNRREHPEEFAPREPMAEAPAPKRKHCDINTTFSVRRMGDGTWEARASLTLAEMNEQGDDVTHSISVVFNKVDRAEALGCALQWIADESL